MARAKAAPIPYSPTKADPTPISAWALTPASALSAIPPRHTTGYPYAATLENIARLLDDARDGHASLGALDRADLTDLATQLRAAANAYITERDAGSVTVCQVCDTEIDPYCLNHQHIDCPESGCRGFIEARDVRCQEHIVVKCTDCNDVLPMPRCHECSVADRGADARCGERLAAQPREAWESAGGSQQLTTEAECTRCHRTLATTLEPCADAVGRTLKSGYRCWDTDACNTAWGAWVKPRRSA